MPGPLPTKNPRRRNAPTIPTTDLPAGGRKGKAPKCPVALGKAGAAWWSWAWSTPQACAWSVGDEYALGRRAQLEDDLAAIEIVDDLDIGSLVEEEYRELAKTVEAAMRKLKALVGGKMSIAREARELDDRYGLTAKGLAALRWVIVPEVEDEVGKAREKRERPKAVDAGAVAGS